MGHAKVLGGPGILGEGDAARRLNGLHSRGSVGRGAGEDDSHRLVLLGLGQGAKEKIYRHVLVKHLLARDELQDSVFHGHVGVGRNNVNMVRLHAHPLFHFRHGHARGSRKYLGQVAGVSWVEVLDQDIGHPQIVSHATEEAFGSIQAACRGANAYDRCQCVSLFTAFFVIAPRISCGERFRGCSRHSCFQTRPKNTPPLSSIVRDPDVQETPYLV